MTLYVQIISHMCSILFERLPYRTLFQYVYRSPMFIPSCILLHQTLSDRYKDGAVQIVHTWMCGSNVRIRNQT